MIDTIRDERAVSVAVTHVLTVGITAILISGLLMGSSSLLETEQERSSQVALETIGERLAGEIASVDHTTSSSDNVTVTTSHQRSVAGSPYTVTLADSECLNSEYPLVDSEPCLILESQGEDVTVAVPLAIESPVNGGVTVSSGEIVISRNGSGALTLEDG